MQDAYQAVLEWALGKGLFLQNDLERKCVDGLYGMYATAPISGKTLLASLPTSALLVSSDQAITENVGGVSLNWIYAAAKELSNIEGSEYSGMFAGFESLEAMRDYSIYFSSHDELKSLQSMHPMLFRWVNEAKRRADAILNTLHEHDPTIDESIYLNVYLNYRSRAFHPHGIVPVVDMFNHSDRLGQQITLENNKLCIHAQQDYAPGDQVFINYGPKDLYTHAIDYNYFDPKGTHFIELGRKTVQGLQNDTDAAVLAHLKTIFEVTEFESQGQRGFFVSDPRTLIVEDKPTQGLLALLKETCRARFGQPSNEQELTQQAAQYYLFLLDQQLQMNRIDQIDRMALPSRLHRFYAMLEKEKTMLEANRRNLMGS